MKLAFFVHDCFLEVGHTHAMLEVINHFPAHQVEKIYLISYCAGDPSRLLPNLSDKVIVWRIPDILPRPFLLRMLFYQFMALIYAFFLPAGTKTIGIGIAALNVQFVNVQFLHDQWRDLYFKTFRPKGIKNIYKRLLFWGFSVGETILYKWRSPQIFHLSKFIGIHLAQKYNIPPNRLHLTYSGVNIERFSPSTLDRHGIYDKLISHFSELARLNVERPIFLFIGAFERKGLLYILKELEKKPETQIIIVGKGEGNFSSKEYLQRFKNIVFIPNNSLLPLFYSLCDAFIFPTIYEPFGLVLIEAFAMGLPIYTTRSLVGASELLETGPQVFMAENAQDFRLPDIGILDKSTRSDTVNARLPLLTNCNWEETSKIFWQIIASSQFV